MTAFTLIGKKRNISGTSSARSLRRQGRLPAIIYGLNNNAMISLPYKDFFHQHKKKNLLSKLIKLEICGKIFRVIPRDIQLDPVSDKPIHVDFQSVENNTLVKVYIGTKIVNSDKSPGIKKGGILNIIKRRIECNCISKDIPNYIEIDISGSEIGSSMHINDIQLPKNVVTTDKNNFVILTIGGRMEEENEIKEGSVENEVDKKQNKKE